MADTSKIAARLPATLTQEETPLATFFDATGALAFGKNWPNKPAALLRQSARFAKAGTPNALVREFHCEVLAACRAGVIEIGFRANVRRKCHGPLTSPSMTVLEALQPDDRDLTRAAPQNERFAVQQAFWADDCLVGDVDWSTSYAKVPKTFVLWDTPQSTRLLKRTTTIVARQTDFEIPEIFDCLLKVRSPARAAQQFLSQIFVPSDDWARRYRVHRKAFMQELLICGWRYLAVAQPKPEHGTIIQIENEMRKY